MPTSLNTVDRLLRAPGTALRATAYGTRRLSHGALDNARRSLDDIGRAVTDRRTLTEGLTRPAAPGDLTALAAGECWELLTTSTVGRLAYVARAKEPDIALVNYVVDGNTLLMRSGVGPKLQAAQRREVVAFEVDAIDDDRRDAWSVVVVGRLTVVPPTERLRVALPQPWATGPRHHVMRLAPQRITGRRLLGAPLA
jgi:nitroimidazol reductase NimA-like FMN-containing flavoprotein (pyridoxamine 5'-phosphate oxidase superfamily)